MSLTPPVDVSAYMRSCFTTSSVQTYSGPFEILSASKKKRKSKKRTDKNKIAGKQAEFPTHQMGTWTMTVDQLGDDPGPVRNVTGRS